MIGRLLAIILLIITAPIWFLIILIIIIEDGSPVLFKSKRIGEKGREFVFYKFRTMKKITPLVETSELLDAKRYILKSGVFLRKYSLDEIPNLMNVVLGDITIIGYRPSLPNQKTLNVQRMQFGIYNEKPGITGLAQICGRDMISDRNKIRYESFYKRKKNIFLDLHILIYTIFSHTKVKH